MTIYIIVPYRPLSRGGLNSPSEELRQLPDGRWGNDSIGYKYGIRYGIDKDELIRAIKIINKNSYYKHRIVVIIDSDVYPNNTWLKEFDNVDILKCPYIHNGPITNWTISRLNSAYKHGIENISDNEWLCYGYISDLICSKHWDKPIIDAIEKYGENYVYVPMFTEIRGGISDKILIGVQPTPQLIWEEWRKYRCHCLIMPEPSSHYFTEEDMDNFIKISNQYNKPPIIIEKPGDRIYGYYAVMFIKAKHAKRCIRMEGHGFDLSFDNRLYTDCNLMKAVVTNSYVFHPFCRFDEK